MSRVIELYSSSKQIKFIKLTSTEATNYLIHSLTNVCAYNIY